MKQYCRKCLKECGIKTYPSDPNIKVIIQDVVPFKSDCCGAELMDVREEYQPALNKLALAKQALQKQMEVLNGNL